MRDLPVPDAEQLLVGSATGDDAAVWRLDDATALVFTTDFFTPIVDDAFDWGRIAAANAVSDVYAMGGRPVLALNLAAWPSQSLPLDELARVLAGGAAVAREAGVAVAGGHTIDDDEPKYGMAVIGFAHPERLVTNAAAAAGDALYLTKPLGTGVVATALKRQKAPEPLVALAVETMTTLNRAASEAMLAAGVRAATDVTGFGLLGHLHRMLLASGMAARVNAASVPLLEGVEALAAAGFVAGGTRRNIDYVEPAVDWGAAPETTRLLLADAQTSGGLLICCPPSSRETLERELDARGVAYARVGEVLPGVAGRIDVR